MLFSNALRVIAALASGALFVCSSDVRGDEVARVKNELKTEPPVWVGQEVSFFVELMSSTFFSGTPHFDIPDVPGAFIMKDEGRPVMGTQRVDGQTWSTQRHHFRVFPHRAGEFTIPAFPIRFDVAPGFGKPPESQSLNTEALTFEARSPPGAEGLSLLISTSNLEVKEDWSPAVSDAVLKLEVGDAVARKITLLAQDVPGMALPTITMPEPEGMSAYPAKSIVDDRADRGKLTGVRTDSVTFVCESSGECLLPAITIPWWDIDANELKKITLPSVTVTISESSTTAKEADIELTAESSPSSTLPMIGAAIIAVIGVLAIWFRKSVAAQLAAWQTRLAAWKGRRAESESACFERLRSACGINDPIAAHNALMRWLERSSNGEESITIHSFIKRYNDAKLASELASLERAVVNRSPSWSGRQLIAELSKCRLAGLPLPRVAASEESLPPLNPTGDSAATAP